MGALFEMIQSFGSLLEVAGTIFWLWMLFDCLKSAKVRQHKGWIFLLLLFTHWFGALIYFFIYVYPIANLFHLAQSAPSFQKRTSAYYTPPKQPSFQEYQQGYQPQSVPSPVPLSSNPLYQQDQSQATTLITDYEEPYATYPEMPPQQQQ